MQSLRKYIINVLVIAGSTFLVLYFVLKNNIEIVLDTIIHANIAWVIVCLGLMFIYYCLDGGILYFFGKLYNKRYRYHQALKNALGGIFWCGITPFSSGGQFAQVYIFNKQGIVPTCSASILLMAFIVYQSVLVLFTGIIVFLNFHFFVSTYSHLFPLAMFGFLVNVTVIGSLFLGSKSSKFQHFLCYSLLYGLSKIKIVKNYGDAKAKLTKTLTDFRHEVVVLEKNRKILAITSLLNLGKLVIIYSIPFFISKALGVSLSYGDIFHFIAICSLVYLITAFIPIPGSSGGSEGFFLMMFGAILTSATTSVLLVWRFMTYYLGLIIGGLIFIIDDNKS